MNRHASTLWLGRDSMADCISSLDMERKVLSEKSVARWNREAKKDLPSWRTAAWRVHTLVWAGPAGIRRSMAKFAPPQRITSISWGRRGNLSPTNCWSFCWAFKNFLDSWGIASKLLSQWRFHRLPSSSKLGHSKSVSDSRSNDFGFRCRRCAVLRKRDLASTTLVRIGIIRLSHM